MEETPDDDMIRDGGPLDARTERPPRGSNRKLALVAGAAVALLALVVAVGTYVILIRSDAPEAVSLSDAVASATAAAASGGSAPTSPPAPGGGATGTAGTAGTAGTWTIEQGAGTFVGYRVVEQLAGIGTNTAVGRTPAVTGAIQFDGSAVTTAKFTADLTQLKSDDNRRDGALRTQSLQTGTHPSATFELIQPIVIANVPAVGESLSATATGNLTLHGVTKQISLPVQGQLTQAGKLVVVGSTNIAFVDYGMQQPRAPAVLSVEDHGVLEVQLTLSR